MTNGSETDVRLSGLFDARDAIDEDVNRGLLIGMSKQIL